MDISFLYKGRESLKDLHMNFGEVKKSLIGIPITPIVGIDENGILGIGFFSSLTNPNEGFFGLRDKQSQLSLIRLWRTAKMFEEVYDIDDRTLFACYRAMSVNLRERGTFIERLSSSMGELRFNEKRRKIISSFPSPTEMHHMFNEAHKKGLRISVEEDVLNQAA